MLNCQHIVCRQVVGGWDQFCEISHRGLERRNVWIEMASITSEQVNSFASENYWKNWRFKCELFMACPCLGRGWETAQIRVPIDHSKWQQPPQYVTLDHGPILSYPSWVFVIVVIIHFCFCQCGSFCEKSIFFFSCICVLFFLTWCVYLTVYLSSFMCLPVLFFKILPGILPLSICNACCYEFCHPFWYYIEILSSVLVVQSFPLSLHSWLCYTTLSHCLNKIVK